MLCIPAVVSSIAAAAEIPPLQGNISNKGFTRIDFCQADGNLYAFDGLDLSRYDSNSDSFADVLAGVGSTTTKKWDPADFAFTTDANSVVLPTGLSSGFVTADISFGFAEEKTGLAYNFFATASRFRDDQLYANGLGTSSTNTLFLVDLNGAGSRIELAFTTSNNSGALAFDAADNAYIAGITPFGIAGLGKVDIYRISREQLDAFADDNDYTVTPDLLVNNVILAGSDSMVIDVNYNIYIGSYVGVAKIIPTPDPNAFTVVEIDGDIKANPFGFPEFIFCGITADIRAGILYYGKSQLNQDTYLYGPYDLQTAGIEPVTQWPADLDGDGIVNLKDLLLFTENFCYNDEYLRGDINQDSLVTLKDFGILALQWLDTAPWYRAD